jgi:nucleolar complex protein 2
MQRSLVELYSLDPTVTYQHGFVFLRQLAVHLRTAIQNKKPVNEISFQLNLIRKYLI